MYGGGALQHQKQALESHWMPRARMERSRGKEWLVKLVHASAARGSGLVNDWPSVTAGSGGTER